MNEKTHCLPKSKKRVAVIGGGWAGLYALKFTLEDGHDSVLFEQSDHIGGIWHYNEDKPGGVWRNAYATSSKTYLHASDFRMPDEVPLFPHHSHILEYLKSYTNHFNLWPHICLGHKVETVLKDGDEWLITVTTGHEKITRPFDAVIVCVGQAQVPNYPSDEMYTRFSGPTMHSHEYKYPTKEMEGKVILVIGGGESASDIANEVSSVGSRVYMSIRKGLWFLERHTGARLPFDIRFSRKARYFVGDYGSHLIPITIFEKMIALTLGQAGHGINEWIPTVPLMRSVINKSRAVLEKITLGKVIPKSDVRDIKGQLIWFKDSDEPVNVDMIIYATGFRRHMPFFVEPRPAIAYKHIFDPLDPTLAYVGTVRPVFGSIVALAELQARWVSAVFSGRCHLPSNDLMMKEIQADITRHRKLFPAHHDRLPHLVSHFEYADYILHQLGAQVNWPYLFFTNNKKWRTLMSAPWTPFEVLLNDPKKNEQAYKNICQEYALKSRKGRPSLFRFMVFILTSLFMSAFGMFYIIAKLIRKSVTSIKYKK